MESPTSIQRGVHDPSNPDRASKHPYDWAHSYDDDFSMNCGNGHLAVIILFLTVLNDESGLSETSVAA
jgi:hypothetical protein